MGIVDTRNIYKRTRRTEKQISMRISSPCRFGGRYQVRWAELGLGDECHTVLHLCCLHNPLGCRYAPRAYTRQGVHRWLIRFRVSKAWIWMHDILQDIRNEQKSSIWNKGGGWDSITLELLGGITKRQEAEHPHLGMVSHKLKIDFKKDKPRSE